MYGYVEVEQSHLCIDYKIQLHSHSSEYATIIYYSNHAYFNVCTCTLVQSQQVWLIWQAYSRKIEAASI